MRGLLGTSRISCWRSGRVSWPVLDSRVCQMMQSEGILSSNHCSGNCIADMPYRKLVIIGDGACGKTSLLSVFTLGYFPRVSSLILRYLTARIMYMLKRDRVNYSNRLYSTITYLCVVWMGEKSSLRFGILRTPPDSFRKTLMEKWTRGLRTVTTIEL